MPAADFGSARWSLDHERSPFIGWMRVSTIVSVFGGRSSDPVSSETTGRSVAPSGGDPLNSWANLVSFATFEENGLDHHIEDHVQSPGVCLVDKAYEFSLGLLGPGA